MPIYEYCCQECGHQLEIIQKLSDPLATDCPACGNPTLKKKVSAAAFRLKGGGWYETDFKSGNKKNVVGQKPDSAETSDQKSSDSSGKSASETTSAKPAGDAGSKPASSGASSSD